MYKLLPLTKIITCRIMETADLNCAAEHDPGILNEIQNYSKPTTIT